MPSRTVCTAGPEKCEEASLEVSGVPFAYGTELPPDLPRVVERCGNLEELLLVEADHYLDCDCKGRYEWNEGRDVVAVDLAAEELWGHRLGWEQNLQSCLGSCARLFLPYWDDRPRRPADSLMMSQKMSRCASGDINLFVQAIQASGQSRWFASSY